MADGRVLDLHLQLLDRQVLDRDGRLVCKVDDLELALDARGRPYITAILVGPRALGPRLGGRLGRWVSSIAQRLSGDCVDSTGSPAPTGSTVPRIDFSLVTDVGDAVTLTRPVGDLHVTSLETWVDRHIIGRIPGSRHEGQ